ncbi:MAG: hypothetical protein ACJ8FY_01185 [Gemmataceae bacterium]
MLNSPGGRIASMDQFRGFVVVGMVLVNYAGEFGWVKQTAPVLEHHNTYFSFADTIMSAFHFAVGFSLRLTLLRRLSQIGPRRAYLRVVQRALGLMLIGSVLELGENTARTWAGLSALTFWEAIAGLLKSGIWNTLTIIAVTSLWVLPVMAARARVRLLYLLVSLGLHILICYGFYFDFMVGRPNWLSDIWGLESDRGLDGGPFGFLAWSFPQLVGSFVYDAIASGKRKSAFTGLLSAGLVLMAAGYALSCLSMLYPTTSPPAMEEEKIVIADSPMTPPLDGLQNADLDTLKSLLAQPPFVQPPAQEQRQMNYWLMCKRVVTLPFLLASTGYSLTVYALFILLSDLGRLSIGLFRTFGQNALAAYIIHEMVGKAVASFAPRDAPWQWVVGSFLVYFAVTYLFVRHLEKNGIYLRM